VIDLAVRVAMEVATLAGHRCWYPGRGHRGRSPRGVGVCRMCLDILRIGLDQLRCIVNDQQFPLMPRQSYVTMGANSSLSVSTLRLCLVR
jgi:hypothetical protein